MATVATLVALLAGTAVQHQPDVGRLAGKVRGNAAAEHR
jgi:hypothetical protein